MFWHVCGIIVPGLRILFKLMDRFKGHSSKNQSKKNNTVEDICNLVKKRGLFDKIRKEVFKDAENSVCF